MAMSALVSEKSRASKALNRPWTVRPSQFRPSAEAIIFLYMDGGPSHVDTFDYKPALEKFDGKDPYQAMDRVERTQFDDIGRIMRSPWKFRQYGECGAWVSDLFPHIAKHVDKLCFLHSMTSQFSEHTFANYFLHSGSGLQGRPSMGAWVGYGLGSVNDDLPGFVVLNGGMIPPGGLDNFGSGFLPASYQASVFNDGPEPVANIGRRESRLEMQVNKLRLLNELDRHSLSEFGRNDPVESAIVNYETAFRMQSTVPELTDIAGESKYTKTMYGLDSKNDNTQIFGRQCLLARRLVERGVRFIEITCPQDASDRWDQHAGLFDGHVRNCRNVDQPIAGLLTDLEQRGMLESTLVVWTGEFGRTPFAQGKDGRDHNPFGFTSWMAGGGVKRGFRYGATDEWGYRAIEKRIEMHDFHATMLHLLGLDHTQVTYLFSSREMRLTDVHGNVLHDIIA